MTHSAAVNRMEVQFEWTAPPAGAGTIRFGSVSSLSLSLSLSGDEIIL